MDHEFVLWVVVMGVALHAAEEHRLGWLKWARSALGLTDIRWADFYVFNAAIVVVAIAGAAIGWRVPEVSLIVPALTVVNALVFHIGITIAQRRFSPGTITATFLYLPIGAWTYWAAATDGVLTLRALLVSSVAGAFLMALPFLMRRLAARLNE